MIMSIVKEDLALQLFKLRKWLLWADVYLMRELPQVEDRQPLKTTPWKINSNDWKDSMALKSELFLQNP